MKNAKYPKNLDILLDSIHKSYRDSKSKKSSQEIKFQLRYGHFSRGTVFFGTPCMYNMSQGNDTMDVCVCVFSLKSNVATTSNY